jgi:hypothetical protein
LMTTLLEISYFFFRVRGPKTPAPVAFIAKDQQRQAIHRYSGFTHSMSHIRDQNSKQKTVRSQNKKHTHTLLLQNTALQE